jgi:nucleoside-diphosphate-sugar epimerase
MTTILITEIDGCIGLRAVEKALQNGMKVKGILSDSAKLNNFDKSQIEIIVGSVTKPDILKQACQGVDIVLHTAEMAKEGGAIKAFREVNVEGTKNVANAAKQAGVKTFVHLSTVLVYGFEYSDRITEAAPLNTQKNPYCQSKIEAEKVIIEYNNPPEFGVIIIRAGDVYGPESIPWIVRPVTLMRQNTFAYANEGKGVMNHVYVDNLIDAMFLAINKQAYGETFNITDGQETSWKEYFTQLAQIAELTAPFSLPKDEMKLFLQIRHQGQKLFRKEADILPESVDFMTRPHAYSIIKAKDLLDYQPKISLEEGLQLTKKWLQTNILSN